MSLATRYLGFDLPHPFLVGACPLIYDVPTAQHLEEAGAAAVVMPSLFEEQFFQEQLKGFPESAGRGSGSLAATDNFPLNPKAYLKHITRLKAHLGIPIIASLNGLKSGSWVSTSRQMEEAGADAIELNLYFTPRTDADFSSDIEKRALDIVHGVKENLTLPLAVKIAPFYTGLPRFIKDLEDAGAQAVVLFNSFFQPDIDIESISYKPQLNIAAPNALLLRTRWIATLYGRTDLSLSLSGGVHTHEDAIKGVMAGAGTVQLVSCLMQNGPEYLAVFLEDFRNWMTEHQFESIDQLRGILSFMHYKNTESLARAGYLRMLQAWSPED